MSRKKINLEDAIDFITGRDLSDLIDLSEESDFEELPGVHFKDDESDSHDLEDEEDNVPISSIQNKKERNEDLSGDALDEHQNNDATPSTKLKFSWRKKNTLVKLHNFVQPLAEPPFPEYSPVADIMSRNRFQLLLENLHFVNNNEIDKNDKLAKIRPIVDIARNQYTEVEPEEYHRRDEQIIPSKTKFSRIRQYNPKKPKKWGFKNLVRAGSHGIMYDFFIMKENQRQIMEMTTLIMTIYKNQRKLLQSYVRIFLALKTINCFSIIGFLL